MIVISSALAGASRAPLAAPPPRAPQALNAEVTESLIAQMLELHHEVQGYPKSTRGPSTSRCACSASRQEYAGCVDPEPSYMLPATVVGGAGAASRPPFYHVSVAGFVSPRRGMAMRAVAKHAVRPRPDAPTASRRSAAGGRCGTPTPARAQADILQAFV